MMRTARVFLMAGVFATVLLMSGIVFGASGMFTCTVNQAGPSGADVKIQLTDNAATPTFTNKWFKVPKGQESRMLAVAMAALINKKKVTATVDPVLASPSEISALYLRP
jgi:hypothetical protein